MIKVDNNLVEVGHFPDGTQSIKFFNPQKKFATFTDNLPLNRIRWYYDNDEELFTLACVVEWIRRIKGPDHNIYLELPYLPNARMDRVKSNTDNFSLKVFANFINSLKFYKVFVENVHSNVSEALINNIENRLPNDDVQKCIEKYNPDVIFFPDEGAYKRYADLNAVRWSGIPVAFGIKKRDWKTGIIRGLDVICDIDLKDKNVLIVDDICSAGGTFKFSAEKLKELGAKDVALYVTHCEDNIKNGDLLTTDLISKIYTTDSILHIKNDKIQIVRYFRN